MAIDIVEQQATLFALANIRLDGGTQSRVELIQGKIDEYAQLMRDGAAFPAIVVFYDGSGYWLADGFHRYHAAQQSGTNIEVEIKQGSRRDAVLYSMEANTRHGIPLSLDDRRRCAQTILGDEEWSQMGDRKIAKICGLSHVTIWSMRPVKNEQNIVKPPVEPVETVEEVRPNRITNEDKRVAVENFFADFPQLTALSNREIAKRCGVDEKLVRNIRKELYPDPEPTQDAAPAIKGLPIEEHPTGIPQQFFHEDTESEPEPPKLPRIEPSEEVQREREARREQKQERNEQLREKGVALPTGKYSCLVVDPPWPMQKIERDERPNQFEFDYPTMSEDELRAFPLPDVAADDCHLYLWTTQKYLPMALRLAEHWGFKYQCIMTWVKNVGITPFSWMYSTEHVLFCAKGSLPLLTVGRRLDFSAKVREHSRKPDEFYDLVREVSPGPRMDVFSREQREGFDQYGNEVEKYG